jgi:hypothetical protein
MFLYESFQGSAQISQIYLWKTLINVVIYFWYIGGKDRGKILKVTWKATNEIPNKSPI